ncbi:U5 small nuclear ribonucleoprotein 40 kDa protein-like isoform X2 [Corticium candelabrum]|uniref:U5 small nuclear ribonucleoprotein 40 kDa protein-like isoform X2 n=1 Tax=Corticium candelabrum TaxID=121492 RepID=UPI002E254ADB|nr:U5 small nuclear ribonucleoprotein 40 kDa protein-like isoform X2 [Corticium candelabrum]
MACQAVLAVGGVVTALRIDTKNGCVVAGIQDVIKVFDLVLHKLVQTNVGHRDAVLSIIHIPERNQYVSASWDKTLRIWNAYLQRGKHSSFCIGCHN